MSARRRAAAAATAAGWLLAACGAVAGGRHPESQPDPGLRIWAPTVVHWAPGTERVLQFAVENTTHRTVPIREPDPGRARIAIFADAGSRQACGVEPANAAPGGTVELAPGDQFPVRVDLGEACRDLRPGEYRVELTYRVASTDGGGGLALATHYATLVVEGPARAVGRAGRAPARPEARPAQ